MARASEAFKLLIFSWAWMEDEIPGDRDRLRVSYARRDWGRYARDFIEGECVELAKTAAGKVAVRDQQGP